MEPRRLVVWIAAGILGFQGGTLALDLLNCTVLSWVYVRRHGVELISTPPAAQAPGASAGGPKPPVPARSDAGQPAEDATAADSTPSLGASPSALAPRSTSNAALATGPIQPGTVPTWAPFDPTGVFCDRPRSRIDTAVSQGLSILAGLALGGSGLGGGPSQKP